MSNFTVGQKLFYVARYYGNAPQKGRDVVIKKVGRKWLAIYHEKFRVDVKTLDAEISNGFCGSCYLSEQHYLSIKQKQLMAKDICELFAALSHKEHTLDKIQLGELENIKQWLDKYK